MSRPFFSIITAAYNAEEFMEETISTMLTQACQDWEWIIINDGSTDRTWEIVTRLTDGHPRIRLLENPGNRGQCATLNRGLQEATGVWVGCLHADDGYRAHTLKTVYDYVKGKDDIVMWTHSRLAVGKGRPPNVILIRKYLTEFTSEEMADLLYLKGNIFGGMSNYLFRRPEPDKNLFFLEDTPHLDLRFWLRYLKAHPASRAVYHPDVMSFMTEHASALSLVLAQSGDWVPDFFTIPRDTANLDWSARARLLQILRVIRCWLRFWNQFPTGTRLLPLDTLRVIILSFYRRPPAPPHSS